jgi:hypothetical protein
MSVTPYPVGIVGMRRAGHQADPVIVGTRAAWKDHAMASARRARVGDHTGAPALGHPARTGVVSARA